MDFYLFVEVGITCLLLSVVNRYRWRLLGRGQYVGTIRGSLRRGVSWWQICMFGSSDSVPGPGRHSNLLHHGGQKCGVEMEFHGRGLWFQGQRVEFC